MTFTTATLPVRFPRFRQPCALRETPDPRIELSHLRADAAFPSLDLPDAPEHVAAVDPFEGTCCNGEGRVELPGVLDVRERGRRLPEPVEVEIVDADDRGRAAADLDAFDPIDVPIDPIVWKLDSHLAAVVEPVPPSLPEPERSQHRPFSFAHDTADVEVRLVIRSSGLELFGRPTDDDRLRLQHRSQGCGDEEVTLQSIVLARGPAQELVSVRSAHGSSHRPGDCRVPPGRGRAPMDRTRSRPAPDGSAVVVLRVAVDRAARRA